jgi:hypothetical protein
LTPEFDLIADEVKFDTVELHKFWGGRRYLPFLNPDFAVEKIEIK